MLVFVAYAKGRNIVGQKPPTTRNNVVTCCVRLHGPFDAKWKSKLMLGFERVKEGSLEYNAW